MVNSSKTYTELLEGDWKDFLKLFTIASGMVCSLATLVAGGVYFVNSIKNMDNLSNKNYRINTILDSEKVHFHESWNNSINYLDVVSKKGSKISYIDDIGNDLKVDKIIISTEEGKIVYSNSDNGFVSLFIKAQKNFDSYLNNISEEKIRLEQEEFHNKFDTLNDALYGGN